MRVWLGFACAAGPARQALCQTPEPLLLRQDTMDLRIRLDYPNERLIGVARLAITNGSAGPVRSVPLLLNRLLSVRKVTEWSGRELPFRERVVRFSDEPKLQVEFVEVALPRALRPGDRTGLVVHYEGNLVGYVETGSLYIRDHVDTAFTILRADAYAFPVIGRPSRALNRAVPWLPFTFHAELTVPEGFVAVTGGRRLAKRPSAEGVTWEYGSDVAVPFLNIAIARYVEVGQRRVRAFVFPEDSAVAQGTVSQAEAALDSLTAWFGPLGDAPHVTLIEIPPGYGSQASLSAGIIMDAAAFREAARRHELYHELAHFWNPRDTAVPSPRVTEGLATLLEQSLATALDGWHGLDSLAEARAARLVARSASDSLLRTVPMRDYGRVDRTGYSYSVGMLLFYLLERCVGRPAFFTLWGEYLRQTRTTGGSDQAFADFAITRTGSPAVRELFTTWWLTTRWIDRLRAGEPFRALGAGCSAPG